MYEIAGYPELTLPLLWVGGRMAGASVLNPTIIIPTPKGPRGSRYQIMKDFGPKSHDNHGLSAVPGPLGEPQTHLKNPAAAPFKDPGVWPGAVFWGCC